MKCQNTNWRHDNLSMKGMWVVEKTEKVYKSLNSKSQIKRGIEWHYKLSIVQRN